MKDKIILAAKGTILLFLVLLIFIFLQNNPYGTLQPMYIVLSILYLFLLLILSFLFQKSKAYLIILSITMFIFCGNILAIQSSVLTSNGFLAALMLMVGIVESIILTPLFPLLMLLQQIIEHTIAQIILILVLYVMMLVSYLLGRKGIGGKKHDLEKE